MYYIIAEGKEQRAESEKLRAESKEQRAESEKIRAESKEQRDKIIKKLKDKGIQAVFHYQSLHQSKFYSSQSMQRECPQSDYYSLNLLRLPLFVGIDTTITQKMFKILMEYNDD
jgi:dTDP-4-amino-4,6-dideoxygalactose transaminase